MGDAVDHLLVVGANRLVCSREKKHNIEGLPIDLVSGSSLSGWRNKFAVNSLGGVEMAVGPEILRRLGICLCPWLSPKRDEGERREMTLQREKGASPFLVASSSSASVKYSQERAE